MPLEGRTLYLEKVVFPSNNDTNHSIRESSELVMDRIFPKSNQYAEMGRLITEAYMQNVPVYGQRLLLSAMMVASQQSSEEHSDYQIGRSLALVLTNLRPAGVKLAQAIHSYPSTPEEIRRGMDDVKGRVNIPLRWDMLSRLNTVLPASNREDIASINEVLGGGAYQYTVRITKKDGSESALSPLQHKNVRQRANTEFQNFTHAAEQITQQHPEFEPLKDIIRQAQHMSSIETDYDIGEQQDSLAKTLYTGLTVCVDGHRIPFTTVDWLTHGMEYKEASIAEGVAFNDLPESTSEEQAYKQTIAKAVLTAELYMVMTGRPFDHDRHGSNLHIASYGVKGFDFGAMALEEPSLHDKKQLGVAVAKALKNAQGHQSSGEFFGQQLVQAISATSKGTQDSEGSEFLASIQRCFLALGDYCKVLSVDEIKNVIGSVFQTGEVNKTIIYAGARELGYKGLGLLFGDRKELSPDQPIRIENSTSYTLERNQEHLPQNNLYDVVADRVADFFFMTRLQSRV